VAIQSIPGKGVRGELGEEEVLIGNMKLFEKHDAKSDLLFERILSDARNLEAEGKTTMIVKKGEIFLGAIGFSDRPRPEAASALQRLKELGVESLVMITGDNERVAAAIAAEVGTTDQIAGLLPQEKVSAVDDLLRRFGPVAMVGDGVNDAPALLLAEVGIALPRGADLARATADVVLLRDDLDGVVQARRVAQDAIGLIRSNFRIAAVLNTVLFVGAVSGRLSPVATTVLHNGVTVGTLARALVGGRRAIGR
jgi:P-type E1-E2 ATPase